MPIIQRTSHRASRQDPRQVRAVLDFAASRVRALIVRLGDDTVEVLGMGERSGDAALAHPGHVIRRKQLAVQTERALTTAELSTVQGADLPWIADEAIVGLGGPLLAAYPYVAHLPRTDPLAPIYPPELRDGLATAQRSALRRLAAAQGEGPIRHTLVASELVGVRSIRSDIGRAEHLPDIERGVPGRAGDLLSIALCNLTWPTLGIEAVAQVITHVEMQMRLVPTLRAVAAALARPDAILVDVGFDRTALGLVEGGALADVRSIPLGGAHFTRALVSRLMIHEKHAELLKQHHAVGRAPGGRGPVPRIMADMARQWLDTVDDALAEMAGVGPLPARFYLFGAGSLLPEVVDGVRRHPWSSPFTKAPTADLLQPTALRGISDPRGLLRSPAHVPLAALAAWAARTPSTLQQALAQVTLQNAARDGTLSISGHLD